MPAEISSFVLRACYGPFHIQSSMLWLVQPVPLSRCVSACDIAVMGSQRWDGVPSGVSLASVQQFARHSIAVSQEATA